jgi:hypothetical protein
MPQFLSDQKFSKILVYAPIFKMCKKILNFSEFKKVLGLCTQFSKCAHLEIFPKIWALCPNFQNFENFPKK